MSRLNEFTLDLENGNDEPIREEMIGKQIGEYTLEDICGSGNLSRVFLAHYSVYPSMRSAIKVFLPVIKNDPRFLKYRDSELKVWLNIEKKKGEHIVVLHDTGIVRGTNTGFDGCPYIRMEYMDGETLEHNFHKLTKRERLETWIGPENKRYTK